MTDVNQHLIEVTTREWWRRLGQARLSHLIKLSDAMVEELELLNLDDVPRVPSVWQERLVLLSFSLPFEYRPRLGSFPSPTEVLDVLFEVQRHPLALKTGHTLTLPPLLEDEPTDHPTQDPTDLQRSRQDTGRQLSSRH